MLGNLAFNDLNRVSIAKEGGVAAIVDALHRHPHH